MQKGDDANALQVLLPGRVRVFCAADMDTERYISLDGKRVLIHRKLPERW